MEDNIQTVRFLDENKLPIDGFICASNDDGASLDGDIDGSAEDRDDDNDLPPLTDAETEEAENALYAVFNKALRVDASQPVTDAHKLRVAQALVDYAAMAMEQPAMAARFAEIRFIQMNPCEPVPIETALDVLEQSAGVATANSVRDVIAATSRSARTPKAGSCRPS